MSLNPARSLSVPSPLPTRTEAPADVHMAEAPPAEDSVRKAEGVKRKIMSEEGQAGPAKKAKYEIASVQSGKIDEILRKVSEANRSEEEKKREIAAWGAASPRLSIHEIFDPVILIEVLIGQDLSDCHVVRRSVLTNLSPHFKSAFAQKMQESEMAHIIWKGTGENPFIHKQAALYIIQYAHMKCGALKQLQQQFTREFEEILGDIVRLSIFFEIESLQKICQEFIAEECRADPNQNISKYFQWAIGKLEARSLFPLALQALAKDFPEREKIYRALVEIFQADYSDCSPEEKLFSQRFVRQCFFEILPDGPDNEELLDIYSAVADLFPDFDFSLDQMAQIAKFSFSKYAQYLINLNPDLRRKQQAVLVGQFFQRALEWIYKENSPRVPGNPWTISGPFEDKYKPYSLFLEIMGQKDFLEPTMIVRLSDFLSTDPKNVIARKMRSVILQNSDLDAARRDIEKALESCPEDPDLLLMRGVYLRKQGDFSSSLKDLNRAIVIHPKFIPAYMQRSYHHHETGNRLEALRDIDRAIAIRPSIALFKHRAWLNYLYGDLKKALQDITRAYRSHMLDVEILIIRSFIQKTKKNFDEALNDLNMTCEQARYFLFPWIFRASFYQETGKLDLALADYNHAMSFAHEEPPPVRFYQPFFPFKIDRWAPYLGRGQCLLKMGDHVKALEDFTHILQNCPENVPALLGSAQCHWVQEDLQGAWEYCLKAKHHDKKAVEAHLQEASIENSHDSRILALLACYHRETDQHEEALRLFDLALSQPAPHPQIEALRAASKKSTKF